jgi:hypothetical protein
MHKSGKNNEDKETKIAIKNAEEEQEEEEILTRGIYQITLIEILEKEGDVVQAMAKIKNNLQAQI